MAKEKWSDMAITDEFAARIKQNHQKERIMKVAPVFVLVFMILVFTAICGGTFFSASNLATILRQLAIPLCVALGLTFVIMIGSIDLSINGVVGMSGSLAGVLVANTMFDYNLGIWAIFIAVGAAVAVGAIIGSVHVYFRIPSFMVSFSFMYICLGIGKLSYQSRPLTITDAVMVRLANAYFLGIPFITWVALIMFVICYFIQEYTAFGRHVYAVGTNEAIPKSVGVNVKRVKIMVFALAGLLSGVAGVLGAIRLGSGTVKIGDGLMFPAQAAVVIGGTALSGGKGGVVNTLVGVLIMTVLANGLLLCGVNVYVREGVQGLIILISVILTVPHGKTVISK